MSTFTLFIGSNNKTHKLEVDKIKSTLDKRHDGYTLSYAEGVWRGLAERTAVVLIASDKANVLATINDLKYNLKQDAVAYQEAPEMRFV